MRNRSARMRSARVRWLCSVCVGCVLATPLLLRAQEPSAGGTPQKPDVLTLRAESRLVVEDVLVTDGHGRPVHGLPASAFHVFDQGEPQTIRRFEEGAEKLESAPVKARPAGEFSNADAASSHDTSEVLLIDSDDLEIQDQMFLLAQLRKSIATLPQGLQVAVFRVTNGQVVQLRGFSTDRDDLQRAVGEGFPVLTHNIDSKFQSAVEQLMTVAAFLQQVPGRKNVMWFAGAFPLVPITDREQVAGGISVDYAEQARMIHQVQEALAEARVSVYPVDVRGVLTQGLEAPTPQQGGAASATAGRDPSAMMKRTPTVAPAGGDGNMEARGRAAELAAATGGKSYSLNNVSQEVNEAFELGMRAYTLEYVPKPYVTDESWHKVRITVDGNYSVSYRLGYLATSTGIVGGRQGFRLEDGQKVSSSLTKDGLKPILFTVKLAPVPGVATKGSMRVKIVFRVPADQVLFVRKNDQWQDQLLVCSYAYDQQGRMKGGKLQELDTSLTEEQKNRVSGQQLGAEQEIDIPKGAGYLVLAVRDKVSRRIGTYLLPMRAVRALPPEPAATTGAASAGATRSFR